MERVAGYVEGRHFLIGHFGWDLGLVHLVDERTGKALSRLRPEFEAGPGGLKDGFVMVSGLGPSWSASGRLGFGLLGVLPNGEVEVLLSPNAPTPRKNPRRRSHLVEEHRLRRGDPVEGGGSREPIMTAYRQRALACAAALAQGPRRPRDLKASIPDALKILHGNVYGWFAPVQRRVYNLTESGRAALLRWPQPKNILITRLRQLGFCERTEHERSVFAGDPRCPATWSNFKKGSAMLVSTKCTEARSNATRPSFNCAGPMGLNVQTAAGAAIAS